MLIKIIAIGRLKSGPERDLYDSYSERVTLSGRSLRVGPLELVELNESKAQNVHVRKEQEAAGLLQKSENSATRYVLDEKGKNLSSLEFSRQLNNLRDNGTPRLDFLIGGPDGLSDDIKRSSPLKLSLGHMTLPHGLARIILVEQLYRAITIISGHPYHRE